MTACRLQSQGTLPGRGDLPRASRPKMRVYSKPFACAEGFSLRTGAASSKRKTLMPTDKWLRKTSKRIEALTPQLDVLRTQSVSSPPRPEQVALQESGLFREPQPVCLSGLLKARPGQGIGRRPLLARANFAASPENPRKRARRCENSDAGSFRLVLHEFL